MAHGEQLQVHTIAKQLLHARHRTSGQRSARSDAEEKRVCRSCMAFLANLCACHCWDAYGYGEIPRILQGSHELINGGPGTSPVAGAAAEHSAYASLLTVYL